MFMLFQYFILGGKYFKFSPLNLNFMDLNHFSISPYEPGSFKILHMSTLYLLALFSQQK